MAQCRDCGKGYEGAALGEAGLCPTCMPRWLASAQATAADYARQWQAERIRAERLAEINRALLAACERALLALRAPTHACNGYNCPDGWDNCEACDADEDREHAAKNLEAVIAKVKGESCGAS